MDNPCERSIKSETSFLCVFCDLNFGDRNELLEHFRSHAKTKGPFNKRRKNEIVTKIEEKPLTSMQEDDSIIECDVCPQKFDTNTEAIKHKHRKHPGVLDRYYCPHCGMLFTIKCIYEKHVANHPVASDSASIQLCPYCSALFLKNDALNYHVKTTHKRLMKVFQPTLTAPPSKKIRYNNAGEPQSVIYCHLCGTEYIVKFNLQKHLETNHTEEERKATPKNLIKCTVCDGIFYNQKAYEIHNLSHKSDDLYVENEEHRLKTVKRIDQDFDIRRVVPKISGNQSKRKPENKTTKHKKKQSDEELSPPSSPDSSDNDEAC